MNDIWLFQAFGDEVYTNSDSEALLQAVRSKIIKQSRKNARNPYLIFGCSCQCVSPRNFGFIFRFNGIEFLAMPSASAAIAY